MDIIVHNAIASLCCFWFIKAQLWNLAQRTTALPFGRGAFTVATIYTLLTEVLLY
jgi:hypothetical protein